VRSLVCVVTSSVVDVPGVVDGDEEPIFDESKVDADGRRDRSLAFCPFASASSPWDVVARLLFLRKLVKRKEGISAVALV